jgi:hypothetical protein
MTMRELGIKQICGLSFGLKNGNRNVFATRKILVVLNANNSYKNA